ncbi:MAG TPA: hypothetical protein EYH42_07050 [Sulfurovum sp.]|nr:hypothetical protein [Sulfurovum sp.]
MLAGIVYFYDSFKNVILEMDIEDFDALSTKELFEKILDLDAQKVVARGVSHNFQSDAKESIIFSKRY